MITWTEASTEVINIVEDLIKKHHPHLEEARFGLMFRSEASISQGRKVIAKTAKVSEKDKVWKDFDFEIWISQLDFEAMTTHQRTALIDHELCHCWGDPSNGWKMRTHDIEEFCIIVERYGLWNRSLILAGETVAYAAQLELPHVRKPRSGSVRSLSQEELSRINDNPVEPDPQPEQPATEPFPDLDPTQPNEVPPAPEPPADPVDDLLKDLDLDYDSLGDKDPF
ncbi:MAG TPA: putative metallopeptidase [Dissulfurispiraceae bacterium]|nr:putative metallopeptidase [Dissulfurispiraceae bacterium]